ncbi:TPA: hypothetical protein DDW69_04845 [candidate division CPR2 bacterium]|nr:hypothetical protein [candidate division CPR2 bacterium]
MLTNVALAPLTSPAKDQEVFFVYIRLHPKFTCPSDLSIETLVKLEVLTKEDFRIPFGYKKRS